MSALPINERTSSGHVGRSEECQYQSQPACQGKTPDHVLGPADSLRGDRNLPSLDMRASERVARPQYWYGIGHVAARSKRTRRNVALHSCARRHVLSTECILSLVGAPSIDRGQRMLELWNNWYNTLASVEALATVIVIVLVAAGAITLAESRRR